MYAQLASWGLVWICILVTFILCLYKSDTNTSFNIIKGLPKTQNSIYTLTLVVLSGPQIYFLGKHCRSRSAGFLRSHLIRIHTVFHSVNTCLKLKCCMFTGYNLGRSVLHEKYSAWQGLTMVYNIWASTWENLSQGACGNKDILTVWSAPLFFAYWKVSYTKIHFSS